MTPEAQRIAIAEACGWKRLAEGLWKYADTQIYATDDRNPQNSQIPNYLTDLNAMHSAVGAQDAQFKAEFTNRLPHVAAANCVLLCELTAKDWADTFIRVLDEKRKDDK